MQAALQEERRNNERERQNIEKQIEKNNEEIKKKKIKTPKEEELIRKAVFYENYIRETLNETELYRGAFYNNEYEVFPFNTFTLTRIYMVDPGLGKRVIEKPIAMKKREINEVVGHGVDTLNEGIYTGDVYSPSDFLFGIYRTEATLGVHYELYFKDKSQRGNVTTVFRKVVLARPFAPMRLIHKSVEKNYRDVIHVVLPLQGRVAQFQKFMERFLHIGVVQDKRVSLTIVYFGKNLLSKIEQVIQLSKKVSQFEDIHLVQLKGNFSRGRGLNEGARSVAERAETGSNSLLFFCDVDIVFTQEFLERCRLNSKPGERVYYPIVFSLYNPRLVYALHQSAPPPDAQLFVISKESGFWRDFGFGMTCQYFSDFKNISGFDDEDNVGWGREDSELYKKYLKSAIFVVRSTDYGIFHQWHAKECATSLKQSQYHDCIRSKALNEASHAQLGILAFSTEIDMYRTLNENGKL